MGLLDNLLGGAPRHELEDFTKRYDQGPPWQGIGDQEALQRHHEVANGLSPSEYEESATDAFGRMQPHERGQLLDLMRQGNGGGPGEFAGLDDQGLSDRVQQDPRALAQIAARMHEQRPGMFEQLLGGGGGGGGALSNPIAKAALAGIAAVALKKMMRGGSGLS